MIDPVDIRPWEELDAIAATGDSERLEAFVESLSSSEIARASAHLNQDVHRRVLETLSPEDCARWWPDPSGHRCRYRV